MDAYGFLYERKINMLNINIDKIEKSFGFGKVLNKISFDIHDNDKIALVGENGSGKSTLL